MRWEPTACQAGDMVRVRLGSVYHYGIFVSEDEVIQFGLPPTAENRAAEGEVRVLAAAALWRPPAWTGRSKGAAYRRLRPWRVRAQGWAKAATT